MASPKDQIERKIQQLHRRKLEKELTEIKGLFQQYTEQVNKTTQKRRRENIYVLFALGIIGGFFTILPRESISISDAPLMGFGIFAGTSLLFLLIKLNTAILLDVRNDSSLISRIDTYSEYIFAFSINGIVIIVGTLILMNVLSIEVREIGSAEYTSIMAFLSGLLTYALTLLMRRNEKKRMRRKKEEMRANTEDLINDSIDEISGLFQDLNSDDDMSSQMKLFSDISRELDYLKGEPLDSGHLDRLYDELDGQHNIPQSTMDLIKERLAELGEKLNEDVGEELTLEERLENARSEYKKVTEESG